LPLWVVGESQAELVVGGGHVADVSVAEVCGNVRALFDEFLDLLAGQGGGAGGLAQVCLGLEALGFSLGDPLADLFGIAPRVERGSVAGL
jgi:hypothetical protein